MTIEQAVNTEINSGSPTQSPKHKKRVIMLEQHNSMELSLQESTEIRKIFLAPFLHYQALIAAESISNKLSVEKIRELKKIACPVEDLHLPFKNRTEAFDMVSGRYHAINDELRSFADNSQSAERQLLAEVQKIYSAFVQSCIAHDEKVKREHLIAEEQRITLEQVAIKEVKRQEEAEKLKETKTVFRQVIANRKSSLLHELDQLKFSASDSCVYQQLYAFVNGLTHSQQRLISEITADLPTDVKALATITNSQMNAQHAFIYKELNELEEIEMNSDQQSVIEVYTNTLKIQGKSVIPNFDFAKNINALSQKFADLQPALSQMTAEINQIIDSEIIAINQHANEIKTLYQNKKQNRQELINASYRRLSKVLSDNKIQDVKNMMSGLSLSENQLDVKAANIAKRWYDSFPLINSLPLFKKAYLARKTTIRLEFAELKRNKILLDAYANIAVSIPQTITREQNMINFLKITNAIGNIEQTRLVVLPNEKDDLRSLEAEMNKLQRNLQTHSDLITLLPQLQTISVNEPSHRAQDNVSDRYKRF
jgi:hypothetical protein